MHLHKLEQMSMYLEGECWILLQARLVCLSFVMFSTYHSFIAYLTIILCNIDHKSTFGF